MSRNRDRFDDLPFEILIIGLSVALGVWMAFTFIGETA